MKCRCKFSIRFAGNNTINVDFPPDEHVIFTLSRECDKHKHFFKLIGKMPGVELNYIEAIIFRQLEFPAYFSEMEQKYTKYKTRFQMIIDKDEI